MWVCLSEAQIIEENDDCFEGQDNPDWYRNEYESEWRRKTYGRKF